MVSPQLKRWVETNKKMGRERSSQVAAFSPANTAFTARQRGFKTGNRTLSPSLKRWLGPNVLKSLPKPKPVLKEDFGSEPKIAPKLRTPARVLPMRQPSWAEKMPPALLDWAVQKGLAKKKIEPAKVRNPFTTPTSVRSINLKRDVVFEALKRGEWCYARDLPFPHRLKEWLRDCRVRLLRWEGGISIRGTPVNGYVTEDGTVFYVAEDNSTFYVQES